MALVINNSFILSLSSLLEAIVPVAEILPSTFNFMFAMGETPIPTLPTASIVK